MPARARPTPRRQLGTTSCGSSACPSVWATPPRCPSDDHRTSAWGATGAPSPGPSSARSTHDGAALAAGRLGDAQVQGALPLRRLCTGRRPAAPELTDDGFLPTGDLVEVAEDGTIRVMGRQKQIIIRGGRNIDINEVEAAIARIPTVSQVCVVPVPDELLGERAAALVVSTGDPHHPRRGRRTSRRQRSSRSSSGRSSSSRSTICRRIGWGNCLGRMRSILQHACSRVPTATHIDPTSSQFR